MPFYFWSSSEWPLLSIAAFQWLICIFIQGNCLLLSVPSIFKLFSSSRLLTLFLRICSTERITTFPFYTSLFPILSRDQRGLLIASRSAYLIASGRGLFRFRNFQIHYSDYPRYCSDRLSIIFSFFNLMTYFCPTMGNHSQFLRPASKWSPISRSAIFVKMQKCRPISVKLIFSLVLCAWRILAVIPSSFSSPFTTSFLSDPAMR